MVPDNDTQRPDNGDGIRVLPADESADGVGPIGPVGPTDPEIREAIDAGVRRMIASIELPKEGPIAEADKRRVRDTALAIIKKYKLNYKAVANQIGHKCSPPVITRVLKADWPHETENDWLRRINVWCESFVRRQESILTDGALVTTGVLLAVRAGAEYAKNEGCGVAMYGPAGIGKTVSLKEVAAADPSSVYVRLRSTHLSRTGFLRLMAIATHLSGEGGASRLCDSIVNRLAESHRLIICDEWHAATREIHEALRDIHDETGCPFALMGTDEIYRKLQFTRSRRGEAVYDQFFSRVGWCIDLTRLATKGGGNRPLFTKAEVSQIFRSGKVRLTTDGLEFLQALACSIGLGALRTARRVFEMASRVARTKDVAIDRDLLYRALIEQAVPRGSDATIVSAIVDDSLTQIRALAAG